MTQGIRCLRVVARAVRPGYAVLTPIARPMA